MLPKLIEAGQDRPGARRHGPDAHARASTTASTWRACASLAQRQIHDRHARNGVTIIDPASTLIDADVTIGQDTTIEPGTSLKGEHDDRRGLRRSARTRRSSTPRSATASPSRTPTSCRPRVDDFATIGPFAYLRPDAHLHPKAKAGAFVEIKNSNIGEGSKVPHLSYIGDADIGPNTNIGAGNITANYDGRNKHRTTIGANVRTSVDTAFVAPVTVGDGAYTAAGSVITEDIPDNALGIARARQKNIADYAERRKP